jgi:hypothetical protein
MVSNVRSAYPLNLNSKMGFAVGNENVMIALFKGKPSPETIGHMSFHLPTMAKLR